MKKLFSIFFLFIFLFNVGGYYLVFWGVRSQAKQDLLRRLDAEEYSSEELVVLTIPISIPYATHSSEYERVNGEFEYNGEYYNLVKQRLENDTLFLVCIKNHDEKKLVTAMSEYSNLANSLPSGAKHTMEMLGKLFKDYTSFKLLAFINGSCWSLELPVNELNLSPITSAYPVLSPPPKIS